ncbi:MAG TPA: Npt1/Npt2 family nucleotide transporter [Myxococcota bacterium]|nr:Npt1/Npt2 family nucleotide transporter [Myxococcota bacterium]
MGAAKEQIKKLIVGLLRIQPGEGVKTALMFGILMCTVGAFIIGRVARDCLFLSRYEVSYLPYVYIWVAIGVSIQSYFYSRIADRFRRDRILRFTLLAVLVATLLARACLYWAGDWFYPVLYVFVELAGTLLIIEVWTLANDVFTTREAKRLFSLVGAGGVVSAVIVGLTVRGLVKIIGTENLLYLAAGVLVVGLGLVFKLSVACREELLANISEASRQIRARIKLTSDWTRFFKNRQLVYVAGLVVVLGFVITFVDYHFKIAARLAYLNREDQLAGFFGAFWAITGGINCFIQFFVTGRLLERLGVLVTLLILPISLMMGTVAVLILPILWTATALKGSEAVFRYTVNDASLQLLYLPVPAHFRGRAKAFVDGILRPVSIGISGVVLAWVMPELAPSALGWILLVLLGAWIVFAVGARNQYYRSLMSTLQKSRFHFGEVGRVIPDESAARVIRQALTDPDEQNVLHAIDMTCFSPSVDWSADLVRLLAHRSPAVRTNALQLLRERGSLKDGPHVHACLKDPAPAVRAAAVEAYCAIGKERAIRVVAGFLLDKEPSVRAATVVGLIRYGGLDGVLSAAENLKNMLASHKAAERAVGARILGDIGVKNFYHPLLKLMVDDDIEVRRASIRAAGKMQSPELLPALVYRIEDHDCRTAASEALAVFGPAAVKLLLRVLGNPDEQSGTRLAVPGILAKIGDQHSMDALVSHLEDPDEEMRCHVLEAIHRLRLRKPHLGTPREKIKRAVTMEIRNLYHQYYTGLDLNLPADSLLGEALVQHRKKTVRRVFLLLGCLFPVRTVDAIYNNLSAPLRRIRSNAIELLDGLLEKEFRRLLLPLMDSSLVDDRLEIGSDVFGLKRMSRNDRLSVLLEDGNAWLAACAIWTCGSFGCRELLADLLFCLGSDSPLVRQTTLSVLAKMLPAERAVATAKKHLNDSDKSVSRYAGWLATA